MQRSCKKVGRIIETRQGGKQNYFHLKVYYERNLLKIKFCIQLTKAQAITYKFAGPTVKQQQKWHLYRVNLKAATFVQICLL